MPMVNYSEWNKSVQSGSIGTLLFIFGEEVYLTQQALQLIKSSLPIAGTEDFNLSVFFAGQDEVSRVREEVETLPMMAAKRLVILREAQQYSEKEWSELEPLIQQPVSSTVFVIQASSFDKRKKIFKKLTDHATVIELRHPQEREVPAWIKQIAAQNGLQFEEEAMTLFHRRVGSQLHEIQSEILKLVDYMQDRNTIEVADVQANVIRRREDSIFELTELLGRRNKVDALIKLAHLLEQGQNEVGVVMMIARHIRILLLIKQGLSEGLSGQSLASFAQVPSYFLKEYVQQASQWSKSRLEDSLLILADTDRALKSTGGTPAIWLENLILSVC